MSEHLERIIAQLDKLAEQVYNKFVTDHKSDESVLDVYEQLVATSAKLSDQLVEIKEWGE